MAVVALTASANRDEMEALSEAGAVACLTKDQELEEIVEAIHRRSGAREAHRGEHGGRARLDRRLPAGARALRELADGAALRPLRRREPARLRRDRAARSSTRACARQPNCRRRRSRRPATSSRPTRSSRRTSASTRCTSPRSSRARSRAREPRPRSSAATRCAWSTPRRRRRRSRCSRFAIQRRLERGTSDEEIDELVARFKRDAGLIFTVDTLEFLQKGGRIGKAAAFAGQPAAHQADPHDRGRRGAAAEARPREPEGDSGVRERVHREHAGRAEPARRHRARGCAGARAGAAGARRATCGRTRRSRSRRRSARSSGTHAGPGTVGFFWFDDPE